MGDDRRMTADRFYGGVDGRLENLRAMLAYIAETTPSEEALLEWVTSNTTADSTDAVEHHLAFLAAIGLIEHAEREYRLDNYGRKYHQTPDAAVLYNALTDGVKGFRTLLNALDEEPMTDEEIMNLLVATYEECEMTTPGVAARHREWLQAIGYVGRDGDINRITAAGRAALDATANHRQSNDLASQLRQSEFRCVPAGTQQLVGDIYPAVQQAYPDLCKGETRTADDGESLAWQCAVRDTLPEVADKEGSRVYREDDSETWVFAPRFTQGKQYRRRKLHDRYGGMRQSGIAPSRDVPVVFIFTGDTGELYGYDDEFREDGRSSTPVKGKSVT